MFKDLRKIDYILFGGLVLLGVAIWKMTQTINAQSAFLLSMAEKIGMTPANPNINRKRNLPASVAKQNEVPANELKEDNSEQQEIIDEMQKISDLLKQKVQLTDGQVEFYETYYDILAEDFKLKPLNGEAESEEEDNNKDNNNDSAGVENNNADDKANVIIPVTQVSNQQAKRKINAPRVSSEHKERIMMDDFKTHEMPKLVGEIANVLSIITNTPQPVGNTYNFLSKLVTAKKLSRYETKKNNKPLVYYGLPEWFDKSGKKLKEEFLNKLK